MDEKVTAIGINIRFLAALLFLGSKFEKKILGMKKLFVLGVFVVLASAVYAQQASAQVKENGAIITLEKKTHDFGDIYQGDKVEKVFKFTNTGNEPLIITDFRVTCGCTTPKWTRDPIMPGGTGEVTIAFNSAGKMGRQDKTVTIVSNAAGGDSKISFTTNVLEKNPQ
jgi:hypothetical protein